MAMFLSAGSRINEPLPSTKIYQLTRTGNDQYDVSSFAQASSYTLNDNFIVGAKRNTTGILSSGTVSTGRNLNYTQAFKLQTVGSYNSSNQILTASAIITNTINGSGDTTYDDLNVLLVEDGIINNENVYDLGTFSGSSCNIYISSIYSDYADLTEDDFIICPCLNNTFSSSGNIKITGTQVSSYVVRNYFYFVMSALYYDSTQGWLHGTVDYRGGIDNGGNTSNSTYIKAVNPTPFKIYLIPHQYIQTQD